MKIEYNYIPCMSLEEFADQNGLTMTLHERRSPRIAARFFCYFSGTDVKGDGVLISDIGAGDTETEALEDYMRRISEKTLVIGAYTNRKEIQVPRLTSVYASKSTQNA